MYYINNLPETKGKATSFMLTTKVFHLEDAVNTVKIKKSWGFAEILAYDGPSPGSCWHLGREPVGVSAALNNAS